MPCPIFLIAVRFTSGLVEIHSDCIYIRPQVTIDNVHWRHLHCIPALRSINHHIMQSQPRQCVTIIEQQVQNAYSYTSQSTFFSVKWRFSERHALQQAIFCNALTFPFHAPTCISSCRILSNAMKNCIAQPQRRLKQLPRFQ